METEPTELTPHRCPRCGRANMDAHPAHNAVSRADGTTHVCPACATDERMRQREGTDVWPGYPSVMDVWQWLAEPAGTGE